MLVNNKWVGEAKLLRKNKPDWLFLWDDLNNGYVHCTRYGTMYKLFFDLYEPCSKVWIGRRFTDPDGCCWATWENILCADSIEVANVIIKFK